MAQSKFGPTTAPATQPTVVDYTQAPYGVEDARKDGAVPADVRKLPRDRDMVIDKVRRNSVGTVVIDFIKRTDAKTACKDTYTEKDLVDLIKSYEETIKANEKAGHPSKNAENVLKELKKGHARIQSWKIGHGEDPETEAVDTVTGGYGPEDVGDKRPASKRPELKDTYFHFDKVRRNSVGTTVADVDIGGGRSVYNEADLAKALRAENENVERDPSQININSRNELLKAMEKLQAAKLAHGEQLDAPPVAQDKPATVAPRRPTTAPKP
jgi:hypothetical protein